MGEQKTMSFKLRDKELMKKCKNYCAATGLQNIELGEMALKQFFENEKNQLMGLSKEQLIELLLQERRG